MPPGREVDASLDRLVSGDAEVVLLQVDSFDFRHFRCLLRRIVCASINASNG
jgi:hypothetical protein